MLRVVIDTSSLVSYVLTQGDIMRRVIAHWRANSLVLITSAATRRELEEVLVRPCIQRVTAVHLPEFVRGLEKFSQHVPGRINISGVCRDPRDEKFLSCAVEGNAHYLVSSDRDLLDMVNYQDVAIVNPGQFLLALELFNMPVEVMVRRFKRQVLVDIQNTVPLEPETAVRLAHALIWLDE